MNKAKKQIPNWVRTGIPVIISGCILWYYLFKQDWHQIVAVAQKTNVVLAFLSILIPQMVIWFADTLITKIHFTWFHKPFPWKEYFWTRGALYLMLLINTAVGSSGILFYLHRKMKVNWSKLIGILMFRGFLTIWAVTLMMIPAVLLMQYRGMTEKLNLNPYVLWAIIILLFIWCAAAWLTWHHGINVFRIRDLDSDLWTAFRNATRTQWLITFIVGGVPIFFLLVGIWVLAMTFGVRIPFMEFIIAAPLMYTISELPIAFAGFGTTTMAWFLFFGDYGDAAAITSFTLFLPTARLTARVIIGTISFPLALKDVISSDIFKSDAARPQIVRHAEK